MQSERDHSVVDVEKVVEKVGTHIDQTNGYIPCDTLRDLTAAYLKATVPDFVPIFVERDARELELIAPKSETK